MQLNTLILLAVGVGVVAAQPKVACGGLGGYRFSDATFNELWHTISEVRVWWNSDVIRGISMNYTRIEAPPRGTTDSTDSDSFSLEVGDFINGVEVDMGPTDVDPYHIMVCSLTFKTTIGNSYGPYGSCTNNKCGSAYIGHPLQYINGRESDLGLEWIEFIFG